MEKQQCFNSLRDKLLRIEEERSQAPGRNWTHALSVIRLVLYRCATTSALTMALGPQPRHHIWRVASLCWVTNVILNLKTKRYFWLEWEKRNQSLFWRIKSKNFSNKKREKSLESVNLCSLRSDQFTSKKIFRLLKINFFDVSELSWKFKFGPL